MTHELIESMKTTHGCHASAFHFLCHTCFISACLNKHGWFGWALIYVIPAICTSLKSEFVIFVAFSASHLYLLLPKHSYIHILGLTNDYSIKVALELSNQINLNHLSGFKGIDW